MVRRQLLDTRVGHAPELTLHLDLRWFPYGQIQVRDVGRDVQHLGEQRIQVEIRHRRLASTGNLLELFWKKIIIAC